MPNEKEVRHDGIPAGNGTRGHQLLVDEIPKSVVRELRSARLLLDSSLPRLDTAGQGRLYSRRFPGPEIREVHRKVVAAIALLDEIGGEL